MERIEIQSAERRAIVGPARGRYLAAGVGVAAFALLTAVGAQIRIPLPDTPVPITLQTLFVVLAGMTLGPRLGALSMALYLLIGALGYEVFSAATSGHAVFGATFGYLVGFVLSQPVIGWLAGRDRGGPIGLALAALLGHAVVLSCGVLWLIIWLRIDVGQALILGFWPFVPGTLGKSGFAMAVGPWLLKLRRRWFR